MSFPYSKKVNRQRLLFLLVIVLSVGLVLVELSYLTRPARQVEEVYAKIDMGPIESCDTVLEYKHAEVKPSKSLGSCGREGPSGKVDPKMEEYLNLISNNGTFDSVKRYVMFFATGRSGHSWLGAILDSAPNAMVANERDTLSDYFEKKITGRSELYQKITKNSYLCGITDRLQVYNYTIPGLWQGGIGYPQEKMEIIGDKKGGHSTNRLKGWITEATGKNFDLAFGDYDGYPELVPHVQKRFDEFLSTIKDEPRFIVNLRHPGNVVATKLARWPKKNLMRTFMNDQLANWRAILWAVEHLGKREQWHIVTTEGFATNTESEFLKLCKFLDLSCPKIMIDKVVEQTHHSVHNSWKNSNWTRENLISCNRFIATYLSEYYDPMCV